jgi:hypothetical protein
MTSVKRERTEIYLVENTLAGSCELVEPSLWHPGCWGVILRKSCSGMSVSDTGYPELFPTVAWEAEPQKKKFRTLVLNMW